VQPIFQFSNRVNKTLGFFQKENLNDQLRDQLDRFFLDYILKISKPNGSHAQKLFNRAKQSKNIER
jgi:hypothetical protein